MEGKLKNLCECYLSGKDLTTKLLKEYGIYGTYLKHFIEENVLERTSFGHYCLIDMNILNEYDKELMNSEEVVNVESNDLNNILYLLQNDENEKALIEIKNYLAKLGNDDKYFYLVSSLVKICNLTEDKTFTKVMNALNDITNNVFIFDIDSYILEFFKAGSIGDISLAHIYFNLIKLCEKYTEVYGISDGLSYTLDYYKETENQRKLKK